MAFGFQGPISPTMDDPRPGDRGMVDYAISRTYRILSADRNQKIAACKICGTTLPRDTGFKIQVSGLVLGTPKDCYVCRACFTIVKTASEAFPLFDPLPSWWKILDRNVSEKPVSTALPKDELDQLIKQREKRRTRETRA